MSQLMEENILAVLETLPLTPNGKVDLRALPAPEGNRPALGSGFLPPRNRIEAALARVWARLALSLIRGRLFKPTPPVTSSEGHQPLEAGAVRPKL